MKSGILLAIVPEAQRSNESEPRRHRAKVSTGRSKIETYGPRYVLCDTLTQTPSQKLLKRGDGEIKEARRSGRVSRVESEEERNGVPLCRGTRGSVVRIVGCP